MEQVATLIGDNGSLRPGFLLETTVGARHQLLAGVFSVAARARGDPEGIFEPISQPLLKPGKS